MGLIDLLSQAVQWSCTGINYMMIITKTETLFFSLVAFILLHVKIIKSFINIRKKNYDLSFLLFVYDCETREKRKLQVMEFSKDY